MVPVSALTPPAGTYDFAPVLPVTDVGIVIENVAPPAGPTSTPKLAAAPMSTGPGPAQLGVVMGGMTAAITCKTPKSDKAPQVAMIFAVPTDTPVATPVFEMTVAKLALELHVTLVVMLRLVPSE